MYATLICYKVSQASRDMSRMVGTGQASSLTQWLTHWMGTINQGLTLVAHLKSLLYRH